MGLSILARCLFSWQGSQGFSGSGPDFDLLPSLVTRSLFLTSHMGIRSKSSPYPLEAASVGLAGIQSQLAMEHDDIMSPA